MYFLNSKVCNYLILQNALGLGTTSTNNDCVVLQSSIKMKLLSQLVAESVVTESAIDVSTRLVYTYCSLNTIAIIFSAKLHRTNNFSPSGPARLWMSWLPLNRNGQPFFQLYAFLHLYNKQLFAVSQCSHCKTFPLLF